MFRYLFRAASAWFLWRWLKTRWRGTLALIVIILLTSLLHDEYVEYVELTDNDELLIASYLVKWCINLIALGLYFVYSFRRTLAQPPAVKAPDKTIRPDGSDKRQTRQPAPKGDGFDAIRNKAHLGSKADKLLER
ncbi:hypothetical protein NOR51B_426 [Luminiphilus syltensis NOR5-1B]|uniref:Uncharacterized protein n=1 Tax=Luminiphilus syltensis NOR5-1B TaxID=565045 RepID=B8KWP9_9GAMM|nr:hypothetical protein [Luminiphilus syltensis]EED34489.1 hypothetical protein NOR51B_426 [Luminiphilus syltensis NOR5-1B]